MRITIRLSAGRTHEFYAIMPTGDGWAVCLAGRQGLGTAYCKPFAQRFPTKKAAREWRRETLAASPNHYWVAPEGKYLLLEDGTLRPCRKTEKAAGVAS